MIVVASIVQSRWSSESPDERVTRRRGKHSFIERTFQDIKGNETKGKENISDPFYFL